MRPFRRRETLNEQLLREAGIDVRRKESPVKANLDSAPDEPSLAQHASRASSAVGSYRRIPRRNLLTAGALVLAGIVLSIGTRDYTGLLRVLLPLASLAFFLWLRIRRSGRDS